MTGHHQIRYNAKTHVGHKRKINEDSILAVPEQNIWLVSDGMGGHSSGDFASRLIADTVAMVPDGLGPAEKMQALRGAIQKAHKIIVAEAANRGGGTIGATVVTIMVANNHFVAFWAGDSRLYRLRGSRIEMLTTDHSVVAEYVLAGKMSWDEAENHPQSNTITRAVGVGDVLDLDKIRGEVEPGDRFLLCSDGMSKYATFQLLENTLQRTPIETVSETLIKIALDGGGQDNISVIVVDVL